VSLDGFRVEIFFSEEMNPDAALTAAASYVFTATSSAPLTTQAVSLGTPGTIGGYTSVIVTHSGSTLGGQYTVTVTGPTDMALNPVGPPPTNSANFLAKGDTTSVTATLATPDDGRTVDLTFFDSRSQTQALLTEAAFTPGVESLSTYEVTTTYPVPPTLSSPTQEPSLSVVELDVHPMTSTAYTILVGPSRSYDYKGTLLPDDDPNFTGVEQGTGTSIATPSGLSLTKDVGNTYGWALEDTTGRVVSGSSYRYDFTYSLTGSVVVPPLTGTTFATLSVADEARQVDLVLRDIAGVPIIEVVSGGFTTQATVNWTSQGTITLLRNQMGSFYSLLFDGVPLLTFPIASAVGVPTFNPGSAFVLSATHQVSNFIVDLVSLHASSTLFTSAWNFIHSLPAPFVGSSVLTRDRIITKRGPLVRGWGDASPATVEDVTITLDPAGAAPPGEIEVASVNPYVGEIYPAIPIPLAAAGTFTVGVDYTWFSNPPMELAGLNTRGLTLNTWDRSVGHTPGAVSPTPSTSLGAASTGRFPMGVALGPYDRPSPKQIGHKYYAYQKDYSALLNQPTTLLLNQNPNAVSIGSLTADAKPEDGIFDGTTLPTEAPTPWLPEGVDSGTALPGGEYQLVDASQGPFGVGTPAFYQRIVDLSVATSQTQLARFTIPSHTLDGVFTGVGIGTYDGFKLAFVGALVIDGIQHVGFLKDASRAHLEEGWEVGPSFTATALSQTVVTAASLPAGVGAGTRFRIPSGVQAGTYTIATCGVNRTMAGQLEVTITPALPVPIDDAGAKSFTIAVETRWDVDPISLRLYSEWENETASAQAYIGGAISGLVGGGADIEPFPAQTALVLPATPKGMALWGSVSRRAMSSSNWDLAQYSNVPKLALNTVQGITALTEMGVTPPNDPNDPWYPVGGFGYSKVDISGDTLLLKSTSGGATPDLQFSYERIEPYLTPKVSFDGEGTFKVESGTLGAGDASLRVEDTVREAHLKTLRYLTGPGGRSLVSLPHLSLSGLVDPATAGWDKANSNTIPNPFVRGQTLEFSKSAGQSGVWKAPQYDNIGNPTLRIGSYNWEGAIIEGRLSVQNFTAGSLGIGAVIGGVSFDSVNNTSTSISLALGVDSVLLLDQAYNTVATFPVAWNDQNYHTYRLLCDPVGNLVVLVVDDVVIGNAPYASFGSQPGAASGSWVGGEGTGLFNITVDSVSVTPLRVVGNAAQTLGRTFGVQVGTDPFDINSYVIPRSDGTSLPNSSPNAIPVEMDWTDLCRVRMYLDPGWGLSVYRPDLPLPPGATEDFITETTDPSAAWINVEYRDLPLSSTLRGVVSFGSLDPRSVTQQRWDSVRYRVRGAIDGFGIAPEGMVLNRSVSFTSGEFNLDQTPEVYTVPSRTSTTVCVSDSAVYADRVFFVQVDGVALPSTSWSFDKTSQIVTLSSPLSSAQHPVTLTFAVGEPVTATYLCNTPLDETVTVLNEGTPPIPSDLDQPSTRTVEAGSVINDPEDVLDEAESLVLNDPYRFIKFEDESDSLYSPIEFCTVEDGESVHISSICDGPGPGLGLSHIEIDGGFTTGATSVAEGPAGPWKGSPTIKGSATHFDPSTVLLASGGVIQGGTLGPGTAILYPNQRGPTGANPNGFGINQDFGMDLRDVTPRAESLDIPTLMGDNVPPTYAVAPAGEENPDGAPTANGNGAVAYRLDDWSGTYSHLGPWGGLSSLSTNSLLAGGAQLNGTEFTLEGGSQIASPTVTTGWIRAAN